MQTAGICFIILGGVLLLASGFYFWVYWIFEHSPQKTDRTSGKLCSRKYKKDVDVWTGFGKYDGPPRIAFTIKHLTKSKYLYRVNDMLYLCTFEFWKKPHKIPNSTLIKYLKAFPRISYIADSENCVGAFNFFAKAILFLGIAICTSGLGVTLLLKV